MTRPPPPPPLYTEGAAQLPFARLVNHGPPLLLQNSPTAYERGAEHYTKPPKHDFPCFDGTAPYLWLDRCRAYFELYRVPAHSWVTTTTLYIEGQAAHWLQAFLQSHQGLSWEAFCTTITEEFGVDEFELEMHKLLQLRQ